MPKKQKHNTWLLYWCNEGLECAINVSEVEAEHIGAEQANMWSVLSTPEGEDPVRVKSAGDELNRTFQHMLLRARFNPQRHYEMYSVGMPLDVTKSDIEKMFEDVHRKW